MTTSIEAASGETAIGATGRPYGLFGLVVSTILILNAAAFLCILAAALALGATVVVLGWHPALDRLASFRTMLASDASSVQRLGIIASVVLYVALSLSVFIAARLRGGSQWRGVIGWRPWRPLRGALVFWIVLVVTILYNLGVTALVSRLYPESNDWITLPKGPLWIGVFVALAVVFAPIAEELLFRGWLYSSLRETIGVWAGLLVSSALFALAHWEKTHIYALAVFPVGVALGFVRERTGSLKASITLHALYNACASAVFIYSS